MFAARDAFFLDAGTTSSRVVAGTGDAGRRGSSRSCGTTVSGKITSAVFSTHLVQSPSGASEKILAPHFRQTLITLIIVESFAHAPFCTPQNSGLRYARLYLMFLTSVTATEELSYELSAKHAK